MNLSLVMVVKDEALGITRTLNSCLGLIDRFDILDTGSTDGTPWTIWAWSEAHGIPGLVHPGTFEDYSQARNLALDLAGMQEWALLLSGDEVVSSSNGLRDFLDKSPNAEHQATVQYPPWEFPHVRLVRPYRCGRYVRRTHEVLIPKDLGPRTSLIIRGGRAGEDRRPKWERDLELLALDWQEHHDPRTAFYQAQTLECLGRTPEAIEAYRFRASLDEGSPDEQWESILRAGRLSETRSWLELARDVRPHRAEPWYYLAQWFRQRDALIPALECAEQAATLPYPATDTGFIDASIYRGRAKCELIVVRNLLLPGTNIAS